LVLFSKKEQKKRLLFEKRSKNFCKWARGPSPWRGGDLAIHWGYDP
jgi:hypothetical protein